MSEVNQNTANFADGIKFNSPIEVPGLRVTDNLIVDGEEYISHLENICTPQNLITLRCDATDALNGPTASEGLSYMYLGDGWNVRDVSCTDTDVVIPAYYEGKPVIEIGDGGFLRETIESITIPATVTSMLWYPFSPRISKIICLATTPPSLVSALSESSFSEEFKILVPAESVEVYKKVENWSVYADRISAIQDAEVVGLSSETYTGLVAHKYDGTNDGMLVFDSTGTAYVGDKGALQPLATRNLAIDSDNTDHNKMVIWDQENLTLIAAPVTYSDSILSIEGKATAKTPDKGDHDKNELVTIEYFEANSSKVEWEKIESNVKIIGGHNLDISGDLNIGGSLAFGQIKGAVVEVDSITVNGNARINGELEFNGDFEFNNIVANESISVKKSPTADDHVVTLRYLKDEYEIPSVTWEELSDKPFTESTLIRGQMCASGEFTKYENPEIHLYPEFGGDGWYFSTGSRVYVVINGTEELCNVIPTYMYMGPDDQHQDGISLYTADGNELITFKSGSVNGLADIIIFPEAPAGSYSVSIYQAIMSQSYIEEDYIPETIARVTDVDTKVQEVKDYTDAKIDAITWDDINDKPFAVEAVKGNILGTVKSSLEGTNSLPIRLSGSLKRGDFILIDHKSEYYPYEPSSREGVFKFNGTDLVRLSGDISVSYSSASGNTYLEVTDLSGGGVYHEINVYEAVVTSGHILEEYIPDTIARTDKVEALETKHNEDIAALQTTVSSLQAQIESLSSIINSLIDASSRGQ